MRRPASASEADWQQQRAQAREDFGDEAAMVERALCALPGVTLPKQPWRPRALPRVQFGPIDQRRRNAERDAKTIGAAYDATCRTSLLFHPAPDVEGKTVRVLLDIPPETEPLLRDATVVTERMRAFRERIGAEFRVDLGIESLADDAEESWGRLRVALVHESKQPQLFAACERVRRS